MSPKLHISNLDLSTLDSDLEALFAHHGVVRSAQVMIDRTPGSIRTATGLVEMDSDADGATAIAMLNGLNYRGQALAVDWATDVSHCPKFESMNFGKEPPGPDKDRGPRPDDPGNRGGSGRRSLGDSPSAIAAEMREWSFLPMERWPGSPSSCRNLGMKPNSNRPTSARN